MCRNITTLRGLEPPATPDEIEAAAVQYVRKVTGITSVTDVTREAFTVAVAAVAAATAQALADLPERRTPPSTVHVMFVEQSTAYCLLVESAAPFCLEMMGCWLRFRFIVLGCASSTRRSSLTGASELG